MNNNLPAHDPIKRDVEKACDTAELSPMDPPDAYNPPSKVEVPYEQMHPFLQYLIDKHRKFEKKFDELEATLISIQEEGFSKQRDEKLKNFFKFVDEELTEHSRIEDKILFPLLHERLIEKGEHSKDSEKLTAVDMLEDEHSKIMQLNTLIFNFFGLSVRLPDENSRLVVLDAALEQGKSLVELLKLHLFREENIAFPLAHKLITQEEFNAMDRKRHFGKSSAK